MNRQEIEHIWSEYRHAYSLLQPRRMSLTFLQASGHAQCAISLLNRFGEDTKQQNADMADVMAWVVSWNRGGEI